MFYPRIRQKISLSRVLALIVLAILVVLSLGGPLLAQTFTQGYGAEGSLQKGMIVRLKEGDATKVQAVSKDQMETMHGVVVDPNDAAVTLSGDGEKVFVATRGRYEVLVSTEGGAIKEGDFITISSLKGVGMKVGNIQPVVIARATEGFDGNGPLVGTATIQDSSGGTHDVRLSRITADINVGRNPLLRSEEPNLPGFLREAARTIAGKPVNATRVYIGMTIFIITTIVAGSLLYGGIRSGIISIGRNPLSKKQIVRGMVQVIIAGLTIFILGIFAVYLLLKL